MRIYWNSIQYSKIIKWKNLVLLTMSFFCSDFITILLKCYTLPIQHKDPQHYNSATPVFLSNTLRTRIDPKLLPNKSIKHQIRLQKITPSAWSVPTSFPTSVNISVRRTSTNVITVIQLTSRMYAAKIKSQFGETSFKTNIQLRFCR